MVPVYLGSHPQCLITRKKRMFFFAPLGKSLGRALLGLACVISLSLD